MELISLAVMAGTVAVSALANSRKDQILDAIDQKLSQMVKASDRMVVDATSINQDHGQADLSLN